MVLGVEAIGDPGSALGRLLLRLDPFPHAFGHAGAARLVIAEHMRMPPDHLRGDGVDDTAEIEGALLLGHLRMENDLQQKIAEFVAQIDKVATRNSVGHLVCLFKRVGGDGLEILFDIPGTAGDRRAQRRHDFEQAGYVARRFHRATLPGRTPKPKRPPQRGGLVHRARRQSCGTRTYAANPQPAASAVAATSGSQ